MLRLTVTVWGRTLRRIPATGACFLCLLLSAYDADLVLFNATTCRINHYRNRRNADLAPYLAPTPRPPRGADRHGRRVLHESPRTPSTRHECLDLSRTGTRPDPHPGKRDRRRYNYRRSSQVIAPIVGTTLDDVGLRAVRVLAARRPAGSRVHCTLPCGTSPISAHNHTDAARCCRASTPPVNPLLPPLLGAPLSQPSPNHTQHRHGHR
jgi:hypothetical protein